MGIGALPRGRDRPDWCGRFYPDDLPQDWRLACFATALDAVPARAAGWQEVPAEDLSLWPEEVARRFRCGLEPGALQDPSAPALAILCDAPASALSDWWHLAILAGLALA